MTLSQSFRLGLALLLVTTGWAGKLDGDSVSGGDFDHGHSLLATVLTQHVRRGWVDYTALKANPKPLKDYLKVLASIKKADFDTWPEPERLAFHINLYNASTLELVIDNYPINSIKRVGGWFTSPWKLPVVSLFGEKITLHTLEHDIIRKQFNEPRVHFALVCAAVGCPPLRSEPFQADDLYAQLIDQGREFFANPTKNRVDPKSKTLWLSPIFKWFEEDFTRDGQTVFDVARFHLPPDVASLLVTEGFHIEYTTYNWALNDIRNAGAK